MREQPLNQLADSLANISDARRSLLEKFLRGEMNQATGSARAIVRLPPRFTPELSFAQERLWFLDQLMPGSPVFNVPIAVRLSRAIDFNALQKSVDEIVRRHEVFRTTIVTVDGRPVPVIASSLDLQIRQVDLSSPPDSQREVVIARQINEEALRSFDLARGPLIRTSLLKLSEQESIFLLTMHHIVSDGWSIVDRKSVV